DRGVQAAQGQELQPYRRALPFFGQRGVPEDVHPGRRAGGRPGAGELLRRHPGEQPQGHPKRQGDARRPASGRARV
ncbi:MAG: FIG00829687: hypothetical protein, partial [uncultured Rubrobacteraceae bacterium]